MRAAVLVKQILDWELPPQRFRIDPATNQPPAGLAEELLGPFESNALEMALQLRDAGIVDHVTAFSVGPAEGVAALRKALALRVDEAVLVECDGLLDPSQTAELLVRGIRTKGVPDLVLGGRQAGDWDHGQVAYLVAERLGFPAVGLVWKVEARDGSIVVNRTGAEGAEVLGVKPPAMLTVTNHESNRLRMGTISDRMASMRAPITRLTLQDVGISSGELDSMRRLNLREVWIPRVESVCEFVEGETAADVAAALIDRLGELKLMEA